MVNIIYFGINPEPVFFILLNVHNVFSHLHFVLRSEQKAALGQVFTTGPLTLLNSPHSYIHAYMPTHGVFDFFTAFNCPPGNKGEEIYMQNGNGNLFHFCECQDDFV